MLPRRIQLPFPANNERQPYDLARREPAVAIVDPPVKPALLTTAQVAELLAVSERTIERLRLNGDLRSVLVGRLRRYARFDIEQYIERLRGQ